ncbi:MAG: hypothetical protein AAGE52_41815 [Myxococcota bacterium]
MHPDEEPFCWAHEIDGFFAFWAAMFQLAGFAKPEPMCELCGQLGGTQEYALPQHNGIYPKPFKTPLCDSCAMAVAETLFEHSLAFHERRR